MHWWRRKSREQDLDRELRSHLDLEAEEQQEAGLPPDGIIKTRIAFEQLISRGIGDTIRVSLTVPNERKPEEERLVKTFREICDEAKGRIRETTPEQVQALIEEAGRDWLLIDVREQDEYRGGHHYACGSRPRQPCRHGPHRCRGLWRPRRQPHGRMDINAECRAGRTGRRGRFALGALHRDAASCSARYRGVT